MKILSPVFSENLGRDFFHFHWIGTGEKNWVIYIKIHLDFDVGIVGVVKVLGFLDD